MKKSIAILATSLVLLTGCTINVDTNTAKTTPSPVATTSTTTTKEKPQTTPTNTPAPTTKQAGKNIDWEILSGNPEDTCTLPTFAGETTIKGWFTKAMVYESEIDAFEVLDSDESKLPLQNIVKYYSEFNDIITLNEGLTDEQKNVYLNSSEENPIAINIISYQAYCEGYPRVTVREITK